MHDPMNISAHPLQPERPQVAAWADAAQSLADAHFYWLATVRPDVRPHVMPVLGVWWEDALHFCSSTCSRKAKNLARDARCVMTTHSHSFHLVVEGEAQQVEDTALLGRIAQLYGEKYEWTVRVQDGRFYAEGAPTAGPPPYQVYQVRPNVVFGFGLEEAIPSTRWSFAPQAEPIFSA